MTGGTTTRVAAIDCGTNSIRLLVADVSMHDDGRRDLRDVHREMRIVRLGQGVDATGRLSGEALRRTREALAGAAAVFVGSQHKRRDEHQRHTRGDVRQNSTHRVLLFPAEVGGEGLVREHTRPGRRAPS